MNHEIKEKSFRKVASVCDVPANCGIQVVIEDEEIALFNLNGEFYAVTDLCPHRGAPLSEGYVEEDKILCPLHLFDFSLKTGQSRIASHLRVETFQTKVEDGSVFILY